MQTASRTWQVGFAALLCAVGIAVAAVGCSGGADPSANAAPVTTPKSDAKPGAQKTGLAKPTVNPNLGASPIGSKAGGGN